MRVALQAALILVMGTVLSCADMPLSPRSMVTVKGSVLNRNGAPIQGVRLYFIPLDKSPESPNPGPYAPPTGSTQTGANGAFALQLPEGHYTVRIEPPYGTDTGFPAVSIPTFRVDDHGGRLDYRYSGVLVYGRIIGPSGSTPPLGYVGASSYETGTSASTYANNGTYRLLLPSGRYSFYAYAGPYGSGLPRLEFEAVIPPRDTMIDLDFSGHEIKVVVTYQGTPLIGVDVRAQTQGVYANAATDIEGVAKLYLRTGGYTFFVNTGAEGITGPEQRYQVVQADETLSFDLTGVVWRVTLRRQDDLSAIPQASVTVSEIGSYRTGEARSDNEGRFQIIVRPNLGHNIRIYLPYPGTNSYVTGVASSADSTFDLLVPASAFP